MFHVPEKYRIDANSLLPEGCEFEPATGNNGAFVVPFVTTRSILQRHGVPSATTRFTHKLRCVASDGGGWEHVSVSLPDRVPSWEMMCAVKDLFWDAEDVVMQLHPAKSEYINHAKYCLHLWRPVDAQIPTPPALFVGPRPGQTVEDALREYEAMKSR